MASGGLFPATLLAGFNDLMIRGATDDSGGGPGPTCTARTRPRRRLRVIRRAASRRSRFGSLVKWIVCRQSGVLWLTSKSVERVMDVG